MTNGEKLKETFPNLRITIFESYVQVMGENYEFNNAYPLEWWNSKYKKPSSSENPNKSENPISSTIKNGISNRTIIYKAKESKDIQEDLEKLEKLKEPTTKNCESCRYYGFPHDMCNYCYKCSLWTEKEPTTKKCITCAYREIDGKSHEMCKSCVCGNRYKEDSTTKNDLVVDAVSREKVYYMITNGKYPNEDYEQFIDRLVNELAELPSVTPQEPRKGHWIDKFGGVYRCSCCREVISIDTEIEFPNGITYKYCPYCGSQNSVEIEK